jgi:hypothetical protein
LQIYNKTKRLSSLFGIFYPAGFQSYAKSLLTIQRGIVKFRLGIWQKQFAKPQHPARAHVPKSYPSPVTDHLIINCSNEIQLDGIEIYDIAGRLIQIVEKDCRVINTSQLSKGTYLLRLFTSEGEITKKFLK